MQSRSVDAVLLSNIGLGGFSCHAKALSDYLKNLRANILIIHGNLIESIPEQPRARSLPNTHLEVLSQISELVSRGTRLILLNNNESQAKQWLGDIEYVSFSLQPKLALDIDGTRSLIITDMWPDEETNDLLFMRNLLSLKMKKAFQSFHRMLRISNSGKQTEFSRKCVQPSRGQRKAAEYATSQGYPYIIQLSSSGTGIQDIRYKSRSVSLINGGSYSKTGSVLEYNALRSSVHPLSQPAVASEAAQSIVFLRDRNYTDQVINSLVN